MAEEKKTVKSSEKKETAKKAPAKKAAAPKAEKAPKAEAKKAPAKVEKPAKKEEKKAAPEAPKATEARAFARDVRITPRKVRLVADLVRGKSVKDALGILAGCNRVAKSPVEKAIRSASANAVNNFGMDQNALYVAEIQVGDGLKMKRYIPRAKGSASSIVKRTAHISVVVKEKK
ncbi:MAG: 50S ribosomal protein L22 [Bacilli bacterium]|nr:50S ribosomal protein L22 [Bacilli bacterium]